MVDWGASHRYFKCVCFDQVMAAIEKINEQDVDPNVADVVDTENWSKDELQDGAFVSVCMCWSVGVCVCEDVLVCGRVYVLVIVCLCQCVSVGLCVCDSLRVCVCVYVLACGRVCVDLRECLSVCMCWLNKLLSEHVLVSECLFFFVRVLMIFGKF